MAGDVRILHIASHYFFKRRDLELGAVLKVAKLLKVNSWDQPREIPSRPRSS